MIVPQEEKWHLHQPEMPGYHNPEVLREFFPEVWAEDSPPGLAINHAPLVIELCPIATSIAVKQYCMSLEA